jgi:hypothetical protein
MLSELREPMTEDCLSDLVFDRWLAGELGPEEQRTAATHLAGCARCKARHIQIERDRAQFLDRYPSFAPRTAVPAPSTPLGERSATRPRRRGAWLGGALAAAALLALGVGNLGRERELGEGDGTRSKGTFALTFFVKHGDAVLAGSDGQSVAPGDQLRFAITSSAPGHLAIFSLDGAGVASVYHPSGATRARPLAVSSNTPLDTAVELDAVPGRERIIAISCPEPFELEPLRARLESERELLAPPGCVSDQLTLVKAGHP